MLQFLNDVGCISQQTRCVACRQTCGLESRRQLPSMVVWAARAAKKYLFGWKAGESIKRMQIKSDIPANTKEILSVRWVLELGQFDWGVLSDSCGCRLACSKSTMCVIAYPLKNVPCVCVITCLFSTDNALYWYWFWSMITAQAHM